MKLRQQSIYWGIIGLLIGSIGGFFYADYYNRRGPTGAGPTQGQTSQLPPDHPAAATVSEQEITAAIRAADNSPKDSGVQQTTATLLYRAGRLPQALTYFERAHQLKADDYDVIVQLGNVNFDIGLQHLEQQHQEDSTKHLVQAARWYERALEKKPDDVNVRTDYGLTYYYRRPQDLSQAIAQYRRSLQVNPTHPQTLSNLTIALAEQGNFEEANRTLAQLEQAAAQTALLAQTLYTVTTTLAEHGKLDEAESTFAKLEKIASNVPIVAQLRQDLNARRKGEKIQSH
jgi:tetratricopeptide (TPR) repeat protein